MVDDGDLADEAHQMTFVQAYEGLPQFAGRSSLRTWLYTIASRVCLDALKDRGRRQRPMDTWPVGAIDDDLTTMPASHWVEPIPDAAALPADADPSQLVLLRESIRLASTQAI